MQLDARDIFVALQLGSLDPMQVPESTPTQLELRRHAQSSNVRDRAFAASAVELLALAPSEAAELRALVRSTALVEHRGLRERLRSGACDARAFLQLADQVPADFRDHWVDEVLDIAYPAPARRALPADAMRGATSALQEIRFLLDHAHLGPDSTFVDLGSGLGKVVLLVALLTGARALGIELDADQVDQANAAARGLGLARARFEQGDLLSAPLPQADAYYMFIPFSRSREVIARLAPCAARRPFRLFTQRLDLTALPWLEAAGQSSYWLELYETARAT